MYLKTQSLEGNMQHHFAFSFCLSHLTLERGIRQNVHRSAGPGNDKYIRWARNWAALGECVGREKAGEEKGSRKESQEDDENSEGGQRGAEPIGHTSSLRRHNSTATGSVTVPTSQIRKLRPRAEG